ncbi:MAG: hypothetical protein ACLR17_01905 [Enterobacteriaceae bacterium]
MTRLAEVKHVEVKANKNSGAYFIIILAIIIPPRGINEEAGYWPVSTSIMGLVSKPYPEPVIMLSAVGLSCLTVAI